MKWEESLCEGKVEAWGIFLKAITKLNDRRKWEGPSFHIMHYFNAYFSYGSKQSPISFRHSETHRQHAWRSCFAISCNMSLFTVYCVCLFSIHWTVKGREEQLRFRQKRIKVMIRPCSVLRDLEWGFGGEQHRRSSWGIMGPKGVWMTDQLTFLYTALATVNHGQL